MNTKARKSVKQTDSLALLPIPITEAINKYLNSKGSDIEDEIYCELYSEINIAETEGIIPSDIAWELRKKYLGIQK